MELSPLFEQTQYITKKQYATNSIIEAQNKIKLLKEFYKDPYKDGSERWLAADFTLDYLRKYKIEGDKRKDKLTENILHEINPLLLQKSLIEAGLYYDEIILPRKVTYQIVNGEKQNIDENYQSMERLACVIAFHDIDEDFYDSSVDEYREYIIDRINGEPQIFYQEKQRLLSMLEANCEAMEKMTFGRKTFDNNGHKIEIPTFNNDRNLYMDAVESDWATAAAKVIDKLDSLTSRYGLYGDYFTIEKDMLHLDETHRLFKFRQTPENMADKYPEINKYFNLIDGKLDVADRCLEAVTLYHPTKLKLYSEISVNPSTAKIDITRKLPESVMYSEFMHEDAHMLRRMMTGFKRESVKHPELKNIVDQMCLQYEVAVAPHRRARARINHYNYNDNKLEPM